ncbi:hypothetical protein CPLU01_13937 [Colletotrichum plurivorum]|uniref:Uncharacterized protein n=1 Tax=Colletotrichum plurivorum TaxID=2175906 RepID=A0A8H6JNH5_9PEZI|nr:hypothetical protein CPLU01_13937 [Colletotrichum plurivorum]
MPRLSDFDGSEGRDADGHVRAGALINHATNPSSTFILSFLQIIAMIPRALAPIKLLDEMPLARRCGAAEERKCEVLLHLLQRTLPSSNGLRAGAGKGGCAGIVMARLFIGVPICGEAGDLISYDDEPMTGQ